ncbi:unnamed protein product [Peniophora sp. CBMAI 1063]|nr:unnamed protein product [Peniophora sp. CBMAI 1063]
MSAGTFNALPSNLILRIFKDLRDWEEWLPERDVLESGKILYRSGWMMVTHVCRRWREIALNDPSLWAESTIDVLSIHPNYIPVILERSSPLPLSIQIEYEDSFDDIAEDPGLHAWLSPEGLRRVESFSVEGELGLLDFTLPRLPDDLIHLKKLFLSVNDIEDPIILPPFLANLSHIEMLWLESCALPWTSPIYSPNLTYLHFRGTGHDPPKSYTEFNDLIARLPRLDTLHLINFVPVQSHSDTAPHEGVLALPSCFRWLEFIVTKKHMLSDGLVFLSDLHAPPTYTRQIQILNIPDALSSTASFDTAVRTMLRRLFVTDHPSLVPRALDIRGDLISVQSGDIEAQDAMYRQIYEIPATRESPQSVISLRPDHDDSAALQCKMLACLPQTALESLRRISFAASAIRAIDTLGLWTHLRAAVNVRHVDIGLDPFEFASSDCAPLLQRFEQRLAVPLERNILRSEKWR